MTDLRAEIIEAILTAEADRPRSKQTALGISEFGSPCDRKLIGKLTRTEIDGGRPSSSSWAPIMGTALHDATFAPALLAWNERNGRERFLVEQAVTLSRGPLIIGHVDVFDTDTGTVIDHKLTSMAKLKRVMAAGPGATYQVQAQGYGLALLLAGHPVREVMILFYPRDGDISQAYAWSAPFDPSIGVAALLRVARLIEASKAPDALALADTADDYCRSCPLHKIGAPAPRPGRPFTGCPGNRWAPRTEPPTTTAGAYAAAGNRRGTP